MLLRHDTQLHDVEVKGRTLTLALAPFDVPAWVEDSTGVYREAFTRGAFRGIDATRTQLRYEHREGVDDLLGRGLSHREDAKYWIGEARVVDGPKGDHALQLVAGDFLRGVSIGFFAGRSERTVDAEGPLIRRHKVKQVPEWSLVQEAAYVGSEVLAVRAAAEAERVQVEATRLARDTILTWTRDMRAQLG